MRRVKEANVAGAFYPADKKQLSEMLDDFIAKAKPSNIRPKALIAPHAGYIYSGEVAASAYQALSEIKDQITDVVVLSPSHYWGFEGVAVSDASYFATPLGEIEVNAEAVTELGEKLPFVQELPQAFEREHALEVHLPFLQKTLGKFRLVPMIVGPSQPEEIELIFKLLDRPGFFFVVSSDLSHFNDYSTACEADSRTGKNIETKNYLGLGHHDACGYYPLRGLLKWALENDLKVTNVDLRNSGDTAGDRSKVVGYGSYLIS